ncbi:MAG: VWA domain-containing protein [Verrucomicrobia bacterium]|nr:VWA domain-containing protein [Verrucomicrobiota bacterium]
MRFASPEWFLLLPLLAAAGWFWHGMRLEKPLRVLCLLLLVLLLARPQLRRSGDGLDLWVLVDHSDSARDLLQPRLAEWETILDKSKGAADRLFFIDFAAEAVKRGALIRAGANGAEFDGARNATRLNSAATFALAQMSPDRAARVLAMTDGFSTEVLDGLAEKLIKQSVPLDYRLPPRDSTNDYRVGAFVLPRRVQLREAMLGEVVVLGGHDASVPIELFRNGQSIGRREVPVEGGVGRLRFTDRLSAPGAYRYEVRLIPVDDAVPGNNTASQWAEVQGGPRVLLVTSYDNDPLGEALTAQGFDVGVVTDLSAINVGALSGAKVVVLNNVPVYKLDSQFVRGLDFFVNQQGGGLAMIGGKTSFAAGGWFGSPVEPLLPVSMELKQEHRKLAVAMAIVMDRSGSMSVNVPGSTMQKMDLADEGAARAIGLLGDNDLISIIPVDSTAHPLSPLVQVGPNRGALQNSARRVESTGGGIFVYTGLKASWEILRPATVGQRHVILFADAADAEEPGDYKNLLAEMQKEKCTVSVIGLGSEKDCDADFLKDVARRGGGRIFFNADANELPALFAQETVSVARSAFIEEPVELKSTPGWLEMAAAPMDWLKKIDGYNLCYLRPGATQAAITGDEYSAPLVAFWQRGTGRVATVAFPMGGDFSTLTRGWKNYGGFAQSLARWLMGNQLPAGLGLKTTLDGSQLKADLFYDETWNARIAAHAPELVVSAGSDGRLRTVPWERQAPGHFRAVLELEGDKYLRGAVKIGDAALSFGPVNAVTNPEWSFDKARLDELRDASARSGGAERVDLSDVWRAPRPPAWRDMQRWLLMALMVALLLEAWQTRAGWSLMGRTE